MENMKVFRLRELVRNKGMIRMWLKKQVPILPFATLYGEDCINDTIFDLYPECCNCIIEENFDNSEKIVLTKGGKIKKNLDAKIPYIVTPYINDLQFIEVNYSTSENCSLEIQNVMIADALKMKLEHYVKQINRCFSDIQYPVNGTLVFAVIQTEAYFMNFIPHYA